MVKAGASSRFTFTLTDAAGVAVPSGSVQTLTLSLINVDTDTVIGAWNNRNVKNVNGGTLTDGGGTIDIPAADNAMVSTDESVTSERHLAVLRFTTSNEAGNASLIFSVARVHD